MSRAAGAIIAARELLFRWIDRYADDREALILLRNMDEETENWDGVIAACGRLALIEEGDEQVDAALRLYRAAETLGALEQARPTLEHVVHVQPQRHVVREFLRHIYQECGHRRELAQLLLTEAQYAEDEASKYTHSRSAADILVNELGDAEAALPAAQAAQALRPDDHDTVLILADVLTASGRTDEALAILEPAVNKHKRRSPELAALQYRMSRVHGGRGDQDTQLYWLKKAFDVDRKDGVIAAELAQLATAIGDYELALKPLRAITLMDTPGPVTRVMALLWEAKIEHARGNKAKAELWAKKALREDPNFQEAAEFLAQIAE
jgi:tetratricopeptide (TPR) repeat protein